MLKLVSGEAGEKTTDLGLLPTLILFVPVEGESARENGLLRTFDILYASRPGLNPAGGVDGFPAPVSSCVSSVLVV